VVFGGEKTDSVFEAIEKKKKRKKKEKTLLNLALAYCGSDNMLNNQLSQKFKLIGRCEFNHLTISLTLSLMCGLKLLFIGEAQHMKYLI
jgi:hypothetical protein